MLRFGMGELIIILLIVIFLKIKTIAYIFIRLLVARVSPACIGSRTDKKAVITVLKPIFLCLVPG